MKTTVETLSMILSLWLVGLSAAETEAQKIELSTNVQNVIMLVEGGVEEEIILAYIENTGGPFALTADEIIYLKDIGITPNIVTAMLHQDAALRDQSVGLILTNDLSAIGLAQTNIGNANNPPPVYVTNAPTQVHYFYESLAPYGTWIEIDSYGWCWRPHVVTLHRDWRPYWHHGRWIYTDAGWYWYSDYSWGWAAFHYGRWHLHPHVGWIWLPDLMWGPAWVSWRFSHSHCGWAPLPPGAHFVSGHGWRFKNMAVSINFDFGLPADRFTFVELRHLNERNLHVHRIPATRAREIHRTTIINNNYVFGRDNAVINRGVPADRVAAASGHEIRPITVRPVSTPTAAAQRADRIERVGSSAVLYRPELRSPPAARAPVAQRIRETERVAEMRREPAVVPRSQPPPTKPRQTPSPAQGASAQPRAISPANRNNLSVVPSQSPGPQRALDRSAQARPAVPPVMTPSHPPRYESPRGRDQRPENGRRVEPSRPVAPGQVVPRQAPTTPSEQPAPKR
jgi:hypothetical protein